MSNQVSSNVSKEGSPSGVKYIYGIEGTKIKFTMNITPKTVVEGEKNKDEDQIKVTQEKPSQSPEPQNKNLRLNSKVYLKII